MDDSPLITPHAEREAVEALKAASHAIARAAELAERARFGPGVLTPIAEAHRSLVHALDVASGR